MVQGSGGGAVSRDTYNVSSSVQGVIKAKSMEMGHQSKIINPDFKKAQAGEVSSSSQSYNAGGAMPNNTASLRDSGLVLFILGILCFTLYLAYYMWRKHRCRTMASKGCQYSRLNQVETDEIDSVVFCSEPVEENAHMDSPWEENDSFKPATLEVITDSLITTSNYSSHPSNGSLKFDHCVTSIGSDLSDEDLLQ